MITQSQAATLPASTDFPLTGPALLLRELAIGLAQEIAAIIAASARDLIEVERRLKS